MRSCVLVVLLALTSFASTPAQQPPLEPGQRIRVTAPDLSLRRRSATIQSIGDVLVVRVDTAVSIPLESLKRLEVYRGSRSRWGSAVAVGAAAGFGIGAATGLALDDRRSSEVSSEMWALAGAAGGSALGLFSAGVIGSLRWRWWQGALLSAGSVMVVAALSDPGGLSEGDRLIKSPWLLPIPAALVGLATGAANHPDRWEEVPLDRLRVSIVPQTGRRVGLGMSIAF